MPIDSLRRLRFGPYKPPGFQPGDIAVCEIRGKVIVTGSSKARIPWPLGRVGAHDWAIVVCGDLKRAIERETRAAVAYWWGVAASTVWKWRKALGVRRTEGDTARQVERNRSPAGRRALRAMVAKARDPGRIAKNRASRLGKKHTEATRLQMAAAHRGRKLSDTTRAKISAALKQIAANRTHIGACTVREDECLKSNRPAEVAKLTGRTLGGIYARRLALGVHNRWSAEQDKMLRTKPLAAIWKRRSRLGLNDGNQQRHRRAKRSRS